MKLPKLFTHTSEEDSASIIDCEGNLVATISEDSAYAANTATEIAKRCNMWDEMVSNMVDYRDLLVQLNKNDLQIQDIIERVEGLLARAGEEK